MDYVERQKEWVKENNIKVGDKVKVVSEAEDGQDGWDTCWAKGMTGMIGGEYEIEDINDKYGFHIFQNSVEDFYFPFFCLEPIAQPEEIEKPRDNDLLREEPTESELELIHNTIYHITCPSDGEYESEWIYRYDDSIGGRGRCNGSYEVFAEENRYWEGKGIVCDEDEIEYIRKATRVEEDVFLEAEFKYLEKEMEDQIDVDYHIEDSITSDSIKFGYGEPKNKYSREIFPNVFIDVYDVLRAFKVEDGALQHLIKKALADGQRGHKDQMQDRIDIRDSAESAIRNLEIKIKIEENE